jgi:predicted DCC family thiol-disulfide oxidoreductase YuxK
MTKPVLTVYYDGLCSLCSREISSYQRSVARESVNWVDISDPAFSPHQEGLDSAEVHRQMHVKRADGSLALGVDGFRLIWQVLPEWHWLAKVTRPLGVQYVMRIGYRLFTYVRPLLPRRKERCASSPYCDISKNRS